MLAVGVEDGGPGHLCMVCAASLSEVGHDALYVVLWSRDAAPFPQTGLIEGGMVRLCAAHLDELSLLILEILP